MNGQSIHNGQSIQIWVAQELFASDARLVRQRLMLHHEGSAVRMSWAAQMAFTHAPDEVASGGGIPDRFKDVQLYSIRLGRLLESSSTLEQQGIEDGDVFVLLPDADPKYLEVLNSTSSSFLPQIPPELVLPDRPISLFEVREMIQRRDDDRRRSEEVGRGNITITGSTGIAINSPNAHVTGIVSHEKLADQLALLRDAIDGADVPENQKVEAVSAINEAEQAARAADQKGAVEALRRAGLWVLGIAEKIGVPVAVEALKAAAMS